MSRMWVHRCGSHGKQTVTVGCVEKAGREGVDIGPVSVHRRGLLWAFVVNTGGGSTTVPSAGGCGVKGCCRLYSAIAEMLPVTLPMTA